jgi:predicted Zn-dependent protease
VEYLNRGRIFANEKGRFKVALPLFEEAHRLDPANVDVLYAIGVTHWALRDSARAIESLESARQAKPDEYRVYAALARCYLEANRREDAVDALAGYNSERSKKEPGPDDRFYAPALFQAIMAHQQLGDAGRARDLLKEFITRFPNDPNGYVALGKLLFQARDRKQAAMVLRKALELKPADGATCFELGWQLSELKDYDSAVMALRRSYTLGYRDVGLFTALSHCYAKLGRFFDAKHAAIEGMKVRVGDPQLESNFKAIHKTIVLRRLKPKGPPTPIELTES